METLFVGQNQYFLEQVDSTNTYAIALLRNVNAPEGTIVHADHQTHGRGQRGSTWNAQKASNITVSIILKPGFLALSKLFYISKITALAVHDVLTENLTDGQFDIRIKWPNDILVNSRKTAGILIENQVSNERLSYVVIGVGLNVNQADFGELSSAAASLHTLTGHSFDRAKVLEQLCKALEAWYLKLKQGRHDEINTAYFNVLYGYGQLLPFELPDGSAFQATLEQVHDDGLLELAHTDGHRQLYDVKDVKFIL